VLERRATSASTCAVTSVQVRRRCHGHLPAADVQAAPTDGHASAFLGPPAGGFRSQACLPFRQRSSLAPLERGKVVTMTKKISSMRPSDRRTGA
jgi:hypothetical protein